MHIPSPPESLSGTGGFTARNAVGRHWLNLLKEAGLRPDGHVLDVGCGLGRIAVILAGYLTSGRYEGFDVDSAAVQWCQQNITPAAPHFRFQAAEVFSDRYRSTGTKAETFQFPYDDGFFDVAFLASVFTHMLPLEVSHYLRELHRVLKPGGRVVASYFLLNDESEAAIKEGRVAPRYHFPHVMDGCRVRDKSVTARAVAFPEASVQKMYESCGLRLARIRYGKWCGRDTSGNQDVIFATRP